MPETPVSSPSSGRNPWPRVVLALGLVLILVIAGLWVTKTMVQMPAETVHQSIGLVKELGTQAKSVAEAFQKGTIRQEFSSEAVNLTGTSHLQFATLHEKELFQREESGSTAWGLIPLPKVVVQAQAPVEYGYYLDFQSPWEFRQQDHLIVVRTPPISPNTPALDVSALTFFTLEGSVWRDAGAVRERLRETLTGTLAKRARENISLVREIGRQKVAEFVEQWLREKFGDGKDYRVKVIFPDEEPAPPAEEPKTPE